MFFTGILVCLGGNISDGEENKKQESIRLILDLSDGSHIMGQPTRETIPFQSSLAKMNIPLKAIGSIQFKNDRETVKISFRNGDQLQGVLNLDAIEMTTLFGKVSIDMGHLVSLRVSSREPLSSSSLKGLLLYFSFDQDEGESVTDQSSRNNRGKVIGAKHTSDGKRGGAYRFDGKSGIHVANLNFSGGVFSVSSWIRTDLKPLNPVAEDGKIWLSKLDDTGGPLGLFLGDGRVGTAEGSGPRFLVFNGGSGIVALKGGKLNFYDGQWHMVTATYENGGQKLYADGILVDSSSYSGPLPSNPADVVIGGKSFGPYNNPWIGDIDELMIFDRTLSAEEIKALFQSQN